MEILGIQLMRYRRMNRYTKCHICGIVTGVIDEVDYVEGKLYFCANCLIKTMSGDYIGDVDNELPKV